MNSPLLVLVAIAIWVSPCKAFGTQCNTVNVKAQADAAIDSGQFDRAVSMLVSLPNECRLWSQLFNTLALQHAFIEDSAKHVGKEIDLLNVKIRALGEYAKFLEELNAGARLSHVEPIPMLVELSEFKPASGFLDRRLVEFDSYEGTDLSQQDRAMLQEKRNLAQNMKLIFDRATTKAEVEQQLLGLVEH